MRTLKKSKFIKNIIIGGGISGLYTLFNYYNKTGKNDIQLFEKESRFGGRIKTFTKTINRRKYLWEEGASRFNNNHILLLKLLKDLNLHKKIHQIGADIKFYPKNKHTNMNMKEPFYYINKIIQYYNKDSKKKNSKNYFINRTLKEYVKDNNILTKKELNYMSDSFGYNSKLTNSNVEYVIYLLKKHYLPTNKFYGLNGGLNQIIDSIIKRLKRDKLNNNLHLNHQCKEFTYDKTNHIFNLKIFNLKNRRMERYQCENLILALPQPALLSIKSDMLKKIRSLINSIKCIPMNRFYCIYPPKDNNKVWFNELGKSTTDSWLRYVIPINKEDGTIMTSYTNDKYANQVRRIFLNSTREELNEKIRSEVKSVFGENIDDPLFCKMSYWKCGVSIWKRGKKYKELYNKMIQPIEDINLYIMGENYSLDQAWIEGALDTSHKVLKTII